MSKLKQIETTVSGKKEKVYVHLETEAGVIVGKGKSKRKLWFIAAKKKK
jgi:hypothetical protein